MKKFIFTLFAVVSTFAFVACSSDDDKGPNCGQLAQNVMNALEAYMDNPTEANEQALAAASAALEQAGCEVDVELE